MSWTSEPQMNLTHVVFAGTLDTLHQKQRCLVHPQYSHWCSQRLTS